MGHIIQQNSYDVKLICINFLKPSKINIIGTDERDINFTLPLELQ